MNISQKTVAIVPAHNEEENIGSAIESLFSQSIRPHKVIVVADNCSDRTEQIALRKGAYVFRTVGNVHKKAGALNQCLNTIIGYDFVLLMDGDSEIAPRFLEIALDRMKGRRGRKIGSVGGIFTASHTDNLLEFLQGMEYTRYAREIARGKARARVITGTGALFRLDTLHQVKEERGSGFYDTNSLTEDNEMTLALKHLGWRCISPKSCVVYTDVMPNVSRLWKQRIRWQRGGIENLIAYGLTKVTLPYVIRQFVTALGIVSIWCFILIMAIVIYLDSLEFSLFWSSIGAVFWLEKVISVKRMGWKSVLVATLIIPETIYDIFQQLVFVKCYVATILRKKEIWGSKAGLDDIKRV